MKLKDQSKIHLILIGSPDPRKNDPERLVDACAIEGCPRPSTQFHGTLSYPIYTCDEHAEEVMLEITQLIVGE